ncbi:CrcB family protein [Halobacillus kuroshimensis]|uniref:Fluoride-specific ion channel FluC n=1 Tax=Halobacillus kuroshimensis TaxID=302481 RepID=A0ABS3DU85_9BACI|nr:CrcB family protein [Halobacillus kuroshimensis]MBN8234819.1 CrcB family protein [Halobacillus kuroshimensis]
MTILLLLLAGAGGFIGAVLRYTISKWINRRTSSSFPWATFTVNMTGSFLLGTTAGIHLSEAWITLAGTGIMGGLTTFSTFKLEALHLHRGREWKTLTAYTIASYTLGLTLYIIGYTFPSLLSQL